MFGPVKNDPILVARSRENDISIVFVHPAEFLVTAPGGHIVTAQLFGDRLLIDPQDAGTAVDSSAVCFYDLPLNGTTAKSALANGDFSDWPGYSGKGVTTTSVGVPPQSIPTHWYGGPGVGATATYDVAPFPPGQTEVPGSPRQHLRVTWHKPPSPDWPGETHHQPDFRFTFLENFSINDVRRFAGQTVAVSFYARVDRDAADVVPILWHSYDGQTAGIAGVKGQGYELFEASGTPGVVAVAQGAPRPHARCRVTDHWQRFEKLITLPATDGKSITAGHYTGVGFDLVDRAARTIDLSNIEVYPVLRSPLPQPRAMQGE